MTSGARDDGAVPVGAVLLGILKGALLGLTAAFVCVLIGALRIAFAIGTGGGVGVEGLGGGLLVYVTGFVSGGAVAWAFRPLWKHRAAVYVSGIAGAAVVFLAIVSAVSGLPSTWTPTSWIAWSVLSVIFGAVVSYRMGRTSER
jgi:hypothetical protein